jgi:hypothetical protein
MLYPDLAAVIHAEKKRQCPCGAIAEHRYGLCRKCQARAAWRRRNTATSRRRSRRPAMRHVRGLAKLIVGATVLLGISTTKGTES